MKRHPATRGLKGYIQRFLSHSQMSPNLGRKSGTAQIACTNQTFELGGKDESEGYSEAKNVRRGGWVLRHGHAWSFGGDVHTEPADCCVRQFRRVSHHVDDTAGGSCHHQGSADHHRPRAAVRRRGPELHSAGRYSLTAMIVPYVRPNVLTITCPAKWLARFASALIHRRRRCAVGAAEVLEDTTVVHDQLLDVSGSKQSFVMIRS